MPCGLCYCRAMDIAVLSAFATPLMAMLTMLWHQQRAMVKQLGEIRERLARIEGYLGIGMPSAAASEAPGAALTAAPADADTPPSRHGSPSPTQRT